MTNIVKEKSFSETYNNMQMLAEKNKMKNLKNAPSDTAETPND